MASPIEEIDPDGDTILHVVYPDSPVVEEDDLLPYPDRISRSFRSVFGEDVFEITPSDLISEGLVKPEKMVGLPNLQSDAEPPNAAYERSRLWQSRNSTTTLNIRMRLSSKHLKLSCEYFRAALTHFAEAKHDAASPFTITAHNFDHQALRLVMDIVHSQTHNVPQSIPLDTFVRVAVIVDYYKCHNAIAFFSKIWIENLCEPLPSRYNIKLLYRLFVSIVFAEKNTFEKLTRIVVMESRGPVADLNFPPLARIADSLESMRQDVVSKILSKSYDLRHSFYQDDEACSFECSSLLLGALSRGMHACHLLHPRPEPPFKGLSVSALIQALRELRSPTWYDGNRKAHRCSLHSKLDPLLDEILQTVGGLTWDDHFSDPVN